MKRLTFAILALLAVLGFSGAAHAQGFYYSVPVWNSRGLPAPGTNVAICTAMATTAASVSATTGLATLTMTSNPITAGYTAGGTMVIANFTGADTYFNGSWTIASVGTTQINFALAHTTATASSNGTVVQQGTSSTACAPLATIYTDETTMTTAPNPFFTDAFGNLNFWSVSGAFYYGFVYGATINPTIFPITIPSTGTTTPPINPGLFLGNCTGSVATPTFCAPGSSGQVAVNIAGALTTDPNLEWDTTNMRLAVFNGSARKITLDGSSGSGPCIYMAAILGGPLICNGTAMEIWSAINQDMTFGPINDNGQDFWIYATPLGQFSFGIGSGHFVGILNDGSSAAGSILGPQLTVQNANPNAFYAARVGSIYIDSSNNLSPLWIKWSGTGNSGWAAAQNTIVGNFASLPACGANTEGFLRAVNDSNTVTWGANVAGSSTSHVMAYCDGTNWTVAAK